VYDFSSSLGGSLFLFNRTILRYFRKDGHNWRKKKYGKPWEVLTCCIATMPMVKQMKNFRDEAIGCLNREILAEVENFARFWLKLKTLLLI
ncbi:hypothetical protein S83_028847, partial [Arachis hypogaea]